MKFNKIYLVVLAGISQTLLANDQLAPIHVHANHDNTGHRHISANAIQERIATDKSINNLLKNLPSVRSSLGAKNGNTLGEITPHNLSFYGERYYNNNFSINGVNTNDNVNPIGLGKNGSVSYTKTAHVDPSELPTGHSQSFWVSPDLLEYVDVLDSNIPSKYGQFTGAVVNAELKEPSTSRASGSISYRTTRSSWTKFHLEHENKESFYQAESPLFQPKFSKHQYHAHINQPLSTKSALLFAYDREEAFIPQHQRYLKQWTEQKRRNESFLLSYKYDVNDNNSLLATVLHSPHIGDYYLDNTKNGRFRESGGGWLGILKWQHYNKLGLLTSEVSFRNSKNQIKYDSNILNEYASTPSINWLSVPDPYDPLFNIAKEGGIGKRFTQQKQLHFKQSLAFNPIQLGSTKHELSTGWEYQYNRAYLKQPSLAAQNNYTPYYKGERFNLAKCTECIPNEQYAVNKRVYYPLNGKLTHNRIAFYLEDKMKWKDLTFVPGVRVERGQFLKQWNIAPRSYLDYDIKGQDKLHLIAGFNRYYADDLLDYHLKAHFKQYDDFDRRDKDDLSEWDRTGSVLSINYKGTKTKTPYSDEYNLGVNHKTENSLWALKWIQRHSKQQFTTRIDFNTNPQQRWLSNSGKTTTNNFSVEVSNLEPIRFENIEFGWKVAASYQKSRTNQTIDYTQRDWKDYNITKMIYKDKLQSIDRMPAQSFNDRFTGALQLNSHFPKLNLTWLQQLNYTSGARDYLRGAFRCTTNTPVCANYEGLVVKVNELKYPEQVTLDWTFIWKKNLTQHQSIAFDLSIFNVLNKVAKAELVSKDDNSAIQTYQPGRQFWLGIKYAW